MAKSKRHSPLKPARKGGRFEKSFGTAASGGKVVKRRQVHTGTASNAPLDFVPEAIPLQQWRLDNGHYGQLTDGFGPALSQRSIINIEGPDVRQGNFDANLTAFGTKRPREPDSTLSSRDVSIDSESEEGLATQSAATAKQKKPRASLKAVRVDSLDTYWFQMFEALTQDGMKSVLRAWIQKCHPSKQTSNPYRGRKQAEALPHADAYHQRLNPGYHTAPEYWPTQEQWYDEDKLACRHLEPYHVLKKERQVLAKHLLLTEAKKEGQYNFNLEKLKQATAHIHEINPKKFPIAATRYLEAIYTAAQKYKDFKNPNLFVDGSTEVHVYLPNQPSPGTKHGGTRYNREYFYSDSPHAKRRRPRDTAQKPSKTRSPSTSSIKTEVKTPISIPSSRATTPGEDDDQTIHAESQQSQNQPTDKGSPMAATLGAIASGQSTGISAYGNDHSVVNNTFNPQSWGDWPMPMQEQASREYGDPFLSAFSSVSSQSSSFASATTSDGVNSGSYSPFMLEHGYGNDNELSRPDLSPMVLTAPCCGQPLIRNASANGYGSRAPIAGSYNDSSGGNNGLHLQSYNPFYAPMGRGSLSNFRQPYPNHGRTYADMAPNSAMHPAWASFNPVN